MRIHDLRHSFASYAVSAGHSLPMIGKLLGHTQVQTTARYAHLMTDPMHKAADDIVGNMARHFITWLPLSKAHARKIEPDGDGAIILTWQTDQERIMLTIDGSLIHLSHEQTGQDTVFVNDVPFFDQDDRILPSRIIDRIPRV